MRTVFAPWTVPANPVVTEPPTFAVGLMTPTPPRSEIVSCAPSTAARWYTRLFTARSPVMFTVLPAPSVVLTVGVSFAVRLDPAPLTRPIVPRFTSADTGTVKPVGSDAFPASSLFRRDTNVAFRPVIAPAPSVYAPTCALCVDWTVVVPPAKIPPPTPLPRASTPVFAIAANVMSNELVWTLAPVPIDAFAPTELVAVALFDWPEARRPTLTKSAVACGVESADALALTPSVVADAKPVVVTVVASPLPASVPMNAATSVESVARIVAPPIPTPTEMPVKELCAKGIWLPCAESESDPALTVAPSPTEARVAPPVVAEMLAELMLKPRLTLTALSVAVEAAVLEA